MIIFVFLYRYNWSKFPVFNPLILLINNLLFCKKEIISEEIIDETNQYEDNHSKMSLFVVKQQLQLYRD